MSRLYLASPYTHDDPAVKEERYDAAMHATYWLLDQGKFVYSPIIHFHPLAVLYGLPGGFDFWSKHDLFEVAISSELLVLQVDGYLTSRGVQAEVGEAQRLGIPLSSLIPDGGEYRIEPL